MIAFKLDTRTKMMLYLVALLNTCILLNSRVFIIKTKGKDIDAGKDYFEEDSYNFDSSLFSHKNLRGYSNENTLIKEQDDNNYSEEVLGSESGWKSSMYGKFRIFNKKCTKGCTFEEAAKICEKFDAHLPFINNKEENEYINEIIAEHGSSIWIGLTSKYRKGVWQRYKGLISAKYFNFANKEFDFERKCTIMDNTNGGKWRKVKCKNL